MCMPNAFLIPYHHSGIFSLPSLLLISTGWLCPGYTERAPFAYRADGGRLSCIMQGSGDSRDLLIWVDRDLNQIRFAM